MAPHLFTEGSPFAGGLLSSVGGVAILVTVACLSAAQQPGFSQTERPARLFTDTTGASDACEPDSETLCLHDGRFRLQADWRTGDGRVGSAQVVPHATTDAGILRFFDADNWEVLIKVLDGCAVNGHYWVYGASTTDLGYTVWITDTATGAVREYRNQAGQPAPAITDGKAFPDSCGPLPPTLASPGHIDVEWSVWEADIPHDSLGFIKFAADFDGDGDDDVLLTGRNRSDDSQPGAGIILINNGDFSFTAAAGDRPRGVHQREVLLADFNGDGENDFFIADHGFDQPPFPGWHNQLLLWTDNGYVDATERLPADPTGFTHNAAVGDIDRDGDVDILVANNSGDWIAGPYFLMNDGTARFIADEGRLPKSWREEARWPWAVQLADFDGDGYLDLLAGANGNLAGESFVHWGSATGEYRDEAATVLPTPGFITAYGGGQVISTAIHDFNRDGRPDILLGGYDDGWTLGGRGPWRGLQLLANGGDRVFFDETRRSLGGTAWSAGEGWHIEHRFFDFNGDGSVDIVPQGFDVSHGPNVLAWLNDGTGRYAALKTTDFDNEKAVERFGYGRRVRAGATFKYLDFQSDGAHLAAHAGVVVEGAVLRGQY